MKITALAGASALVLALAASLTTASASPPAPMAAPVISVGDVPALADARRELVAEGLEHPWAIAFLPDGSALVTERPGRLRIIREGRLVAEPVAGVPAVFDQGQGGLLDIALHPQFATNRLVYLTYSTGTAQANRLTLARASFDGRALSNVQVLWENPDTKTGGAHFGSRLAWMADGTLLMTVGDGGNPPIMFGDAPIRDQAQNPGTAFGKVLRLNADGTVPRDNPLVGRAGANPAVWSWGHRNAQGIVVAPDGAVWSNEHGALGGDELNRLVAGANFGWPLVTHSREYLGPEITTERTRAGMVDPVMVWQGATAPGALMMHSGAGFPQWRGDLFSASLITQDVRRIDLDAQGRPAGETALRVGARVPRGGRGAGRGDLGGDRRAGGPHLPLCPAPGHRQRRPAVNPGPQLSTRISPLWSEPGPLRPGFLWAQGDAVCGSCAHGGARSVGGQAAAAVVGARASAPGFPLGRGRCGVWVVRARRRAVRGGVRLRRRPRPRPRPSAAHAPDAPSSRRCAAGSA